MLMFSNQWPSWERFRWALLASSSEVMVRGDMHAYKSTAQTAR
jgi:uncharacterized protein YegP (UPF0339 family)